MFFLMLTGFSKFFAIFNNYLSKGTPWWRADSKNWSDHTPFSVRLFYCGLAMIIDSWWRQCVASGSGQCWIRHGPVPVITPGMDPELGTRQCARSRQTGPQYHIPTLGTTLYHIPTQGTKVSCISWVGTCVVFCPVQGIKQIKNWKYTALT